MSTPFVREPRYVVFKLKDMIKYLTTEELAVVEGIGIKLNRSRALDGRPPFNAVVVEQDWPEFEMVWHSIERRCALRTPEEWCAMLGFKVLDPDGWRAGCRYGEQAWDKPITREEFQQRALLSTVSDLTRVARVREHGSDAEY